MFTAVLFAVTKKLPNVYWQLNEENEVYTSSGMLLSLKKEGNYIW